MSVDLLVHLGYLLMLCALLARDMLWLRLLLTLAQCALATYAWTHELLAVTVWNSLFVLINSGWTLLILRERHAVRVPPELRAWHQSHFAALPAAAFLKFWRQGQAQTVTGARLIEADHEPSLLYFILRGSVRVHRDGRELAQLPAGYFVGEMSLLSGRVATADVTAQGVVELRAWSFSWLRQVRAEQPLLWSQIQSVLGYDLVEKIRRASSDPIQGVEGASGGGESAGGTAPSASVVGGAGDSGTEVAAAAASPLPGGPAAASGLGGESSPIIGVPAGGV